MGGNSTNYNGYKFRADYAGTQTYSDPLLVTADVNNPVGIAVGGSALSPSHRVPASPRLGGEEIQVASLYFLPGLLAQFSNSAIADSNGEHLYYYHSDHLGTPLFLTDTDGVVVWRGEYLPFGEVFSEDKDPDGDGVDVEQPFRFPGQYEDVETGLYYNYFRDYDPALGRYVEADPIGLAGGVNLCLYTDIGGKELIPTNPYYYTDSDPANYVDQFGLAPLPGAEYDWENYGLSIPLGKSCEDVCRNGLKGCYHSATIAGITAGATCTAVCVAVTKQPNLCRVSCAASGAIVNQSLKVKCLQAYKTCLNNCRTCPE